MVHATTTPCSVNKLKRQRSKDMLSLDSMPMLVFQQFQLQLQSDPEFFFSYMVNQRPDSNNLIQPERTSWTI